MNNEEAALIGQNLQQQLHLWTFLLSILNWTLAWVIWDDWLLHRTQLGQKLDLKRESSWPSVY